MVKNEAQSFVGITMMTSLNALIKIYRYVVHTLNFSRGEGGRFFFFYKGENATFGSFRVGGIK